MEGSREPNHIADEVFSPIIELIPEGNRKIDLPEWHGLLHGHDAMEKCSGWAEVRPIDAHLVERLGIHDVEAAVSVHRYFGESLWADDRVDNKRIPPRVRDGIRMVSPVKGYGRLRPPKEGRCGRLGRVDLAACDLLTTFGVVGR